MNAVVFRGPSALVRWGYHPAATLGAWEITSDHAGGGSLSAQIETQDAYRVSQRPLTLVTPNGWTWSIATLQIADGALSATLAPLESQQHVEGMVCQS